MSVNVSRVREAAEAVCGGLWKTGLFDYLGDTEEGTSTWFTCGTKPHIIRVEVQRSKLHDSVAVNVDFPAIVGREIKHGRITCRVNCGSKYSRRETEISAEHAVRRCLEIYRDVLEAKGVADPAIVQRVLRAEANAPAEVEEFEL